ncbi:MAG TPA: hypothetical protein VNL94_02210 [Candidatus Binatia bacterium]|nr:hypothetical protein [Candidatus Binatia bacterium]
MPDDRTRTGGGTGSTRGASGGSSAEDRATEARLEAERDVGLLDNPDIPSEPGEIRHLVYFAAVVALGIALNLVAMLVVAGVR